MLVSTKSKSTFVNKSKSQILPMGTVMSVCNNRVNEGPLVPSPLDFAGPFKGQVLLIVMDSYIKWLEVVRVPSTSLQTFIKALCLIFAIHGLLDTVVMDNGTAFTGSERNYQRAVPVSPAIFHKCCSKIKCSWHIEPLRD